jgi:hypothetical protein
MGNVVGFAESLMDNLNPLTPEQGAATSVYGSFEPSLKGKSMAPYCL